MFSKNLSLTILQLCSSRDLSYEKAAELCGLSPRYFGSVARGQTNASIITLLAADLLCRAQVLAAFFLPAGKKSIKSIFSGSVYVGENTSRSESVERSEARV